MARVVAECHLWGELFSPMALSGIPHIQIEAADEPGTLGKLGLYKGKPLPYGACHVCVPDGVAEEPIEWLADFVTKQKDEFAAAGATNIVFWIYWYGIQGNMEFSVRQLAKLAATAIPLAIDYIQTEDGTN